MSAERCYVRPMQWPGFQPKCHENGCENDARWHVSFQYYEAYRCDEHKPGEPLPSLSAGTDETETA